MEDVICNIDINNMETRETAENVQKGETYPQTSKNETAKSIKRHPVKLYVLDMKMCERKSMFTFYLYL